MPWSTPTLREVRSIVRDSVRARLPGADAAVPNSVLRVMSDAQGALCHLTLQYIDWLALQLLPDTAEQEWLDRHGKIWLVNADGTTGRKMATLATGIAAFTGAIGVVIPNGTRLETGGVGYETLTDITLGEVQPSEGPIRALDPGSIGNFPPQTGMTIAYPGVETATVVKHDTGTDEETDEELRARVLRRIRQPPMGGAAYDYEAWALAVPGVTRAWCMGTEMGTGTVTVRFMMDDLRADNDGFPLPSDIAIVRAYIDSKRPVTVKDFWVEAPIPYPVNLHFTFLDRDDPETRAAIIASLQQEFFERAAPGQLWYRSWSDEGIAAAPGVRAYDLVAADVAMPAPGYMPVLGNVTFGVAHA